MADNVDEQRIRYGDQLRKNGWHIRNNQDRGGNADLFMITKNNISVYCGYSNAMICYMNVIGPEEGVHLVERKLIYVWYGTYSNSGSIYDYRLDSLEDLIDILNMSDSFESVIMRLERKLLENVLEKL